jgi:hypothetical protein
MEVPRGLKPALQRCRLVLAAEMQPLVDCVQSQFQAVGNTEPVEDVVQMIFHALAIVRMQRSGTEDGMRRLVHQPRYAEI